MRAEVAVPRNVKQAVPFFMVTDIEAAVRFYVEGLGFATTREWRPERAAGRLQRMHAMWSALISKERQ